jgi:hypothetical protein
VKILTTQIILCGRLPGGLNASDPCIAESVFDAAMRDGLPAAIPVPLDLKARLLALKHASLLASIPQRYTREVDATRRPCQSQCKRF